MLAQELPITVSPILAAPVRVMQDAGALHRITAELVESNAADNVRYVEIDFTLRQGYPTPVVAVVPPVVADI